MRKLIFILIIAGCFAIGYLSRGTLGILALLLSFLSFVLGIAIYEDLASERL